MDSKQNINLEEAFPLYLLSEKGSPSCERMAQVLWISWDMIINFLKKVELKWEDLYKRIENKIDSKIGWILAVDDTVQDRLRSYESKNDLVCQHYSGNHKSIVNGVDIVTLFWVQWDQRVPLTFRIYTRYWEKTKHDLLREMVDEVLSWWFKPSLVSADNFYATNENIAMLIQKRIGVFMGVKSNRLTRDIDAFEKSRNYVAICEQSIPSEWRMLHVKGIWLMKVFVFDDRYYVYHSWKDETKNDYEETHKLTREEAEVIHRWHWCIEEYHRAMKQLCNLEWMIFRQKNQIVNQIFYAIFSYCLLEFTRINQWLKSRYACVSNQTIESTQNLFNKMSIIDLCII